MSIIPKYLSDEIPDIPISIWSCQSVVESRSKAYTQIVTSLNIDVNKTDEGNRCKLLVVVAAT